MVSVLMTVYNREKYVDQAIKSVLDSTYQDWELIVVDDCSTDRSVEIVRSYSNKDKRIKLFINDTNLGDYPNRNRAAALAKGKYLKYVDADDKIYPYGLEQLVFYMERYPEAGYGLCSLDQDDDQIFPFLLNPEEAYFYHYCKKPIFHKAPLSAIIRKNAFEVVGGFSGKRMLGDFELWHLLSRRFPVVLMPHGIVWYRKHENQEMALHRKDPFEPFRYLLLQKELLCHPDCPLSLMDKKEVLQKTVKKEARTILSAFRNYPYKKGIQLLNASDLNIFQIVKLGIFYKWE